jgi:hypothetical protein
MAGASGMCDEHVKEWLRDVQQEEDPEGQGAVGAGDNWRLFVQLVQAAWTHGLIPRQLFWSIVVVIPKGGGDYYCRIGLLEPIWKCIDRVIDHCVNAIELHDSLHRCRGSCGTGTTSIEAKLAQQLSYFELKPFYGVFLDLPKAFDAMDRERCILLLGGAMARYLFGWLLAGLLAGCHHGMLSSWVLRPAFQGRLWCYSGRTSVC